MFFVFFCTSLGAEAIPAPGVSVELSCDKPAFLKGEPIGIRLLVRNDSDHDIRLPVNYPTIQEPDSSGLHLDLERSGLKAREKSARQVALEDFGGEVPLVPVRAGRQWVTTVYLQRYALQPEPGTYRLPYSLDLPYRVEQPIGKGGELQARGELQFRIDPATPDELRPILARYASRLKSDEFWARRVAIEALSVVQDPLVVPHLVQMLRLGYADYGLAALAQFPRDEEARSAVVASLDSERPSVVVQALGTLKGWRYTLKPEELRALLGRGDAQVREAALDYIKAMDRVEYRGLEGP